MSGLKKKLILTGIAAVMMLGGCSKDIDVYEPVPAPFVKNVIETKILWKKSVGSGVGKYYTQLAPTFDEVKVYAASRNGDVYAFNKDDGSREWHLDIDDEEENDNRRSTYVSPRCRYG